MSKAQTENTVIKGLDFIISLIGTKGIRHVLTRLQAVESLSDPEKQNKIITCKIGDVMALLGIAESHVYRLTARGRIRKVNVGRWCLRSIIEELKRREKKCVCAGCTECKHKHLCKIASAKFIHNKCNLCV